MSQVPTEFTSIEWIMRNAAFQRGVADFRARRRPDFDSVKGDWEYERGRAFAAIAPPKMPILKNGRLHRPAEMIFRKAIADGDII